MKVLLLNGAVFASLATLGSSFKGCSRFEVRQHTSISLHDNKNEVVVVDDGMVLSRRNFGHGFSSAAAAAFILVGTTSGGGKAANAVIDKFGADQKKESGNFRATYLTEPTEEFIRNEDKAGDFKRKQLQIKQKFVDVLTRFTNESNSEDEIIKDLKELRELVVVTGGLPIGIKKEQIYKLIRVKKRLSWSTPQEIAYQDLIREILRQQSPNTDKDVFNYEIG